MDMSCFIILIAIYVASCSKMIAANNLNSTILKEWMFQFQLLNESDWDIYEISKQHDGQQLLTRLKGESVGCTSIIPVISKILCIDWNNNDGFKLQFKWSGDKNSTKKTEKEAKGKYDELNDKELRFNVDGDWTKMASSSNGDVKCYWSAGWRLCAHIHPLNVNLLTVSVVANKENVRRLIGDYINDKYAYNSHGHSSDQNNNNHIPSSLKTLKKLERELSLGHIRIDFTQKSTTGPPLLPGIYFMNKVYNTLNGQPIYEQFGVDIIDYTFGDSDGRHP
eukprot:285001_1